MTTTSTAYLNRLTMALEDLLRCRGFCEAMLNLPTGEAYSDERTIFDALFLAFVVSYGRCFCSSKTARKQDMEEVSRKFGGLRLQVTESLPTSESAFHARVLELRHKAFAHSQASIHNHRYYGKMGVPLSRNPFYPPEPDEVSTALAITNKLITAVGDEQVKERKRLFPNAQV